MTMFYKIARFLMGICIGGSIIFLFDQFLTWGIPTNFKAVWSITTTIVVGMWGGLLLTGYGEE